SPRVAEFEKNFAGYCQAGHCAGVNSGTAALFLALKAAGIGPGDEVITTANTFIATSASISAAGAKPVFVDIDGTTFNIDPRKIEAAVTPKTKAVIPVHLYGQPADMDPIMDIAAKHGIIIIEDACQAHGAEYKGKRAGSFGKAACFSFYPGKNLGAFGEGGAVVTDDGRIDEEVRILRDHGSREKYMHIREGFNMRLEGMQGAALRLKLKKLDEWNGLRRASAGIYRRELADTGGILLPEEKGHVKHVYHLFVVRVKEREKMQDCLKQKGIATGFHYKYPLHLQEAYKYLGHKEGDLPVTEKVMKEIISLPMYPGLTEEQVVYVCGEVKNFLSDKA
ncbi:MAG: DegT/DnrJ/EryC1/StrS family aminotransferase, partial [Candidatus Omnitrophica bacterium]|nr:DegT/DnrJ/EryC1/StrS family aminotransferase [Candidatus Omnitrophota bacterium]